MTPRKFLIANYPLTTHLAKTAAIAFLISAFLIAIESWKIVDNQYIQFPLSILMGVTLFSGAFLMVFSTWGVATHSSELDGIGLFFALVWLIPFLAIIVMLSFTGERAKPRTPTISS